MPAATIIDGVAISATIKEEVKARVVALGKPVKLVAILVGATSAGELYALRQGEACRALGIDYQLITLPADVTQRHA